MCFIIILLWIWCRTIIQRTYRWTGIWSGIKSFPKRSSIRSLIWRRMWLRLDSFREILFIVPLSNGEIKELFTTSIVNQSTIIWLQYATLSWYDYWCLAQPEPQLNASDDVLCAVNWLRRWLIDLWFVELEKLPRVFVLRFHQDFLFPYLTNDIYCGFGMRVDCIRFCRSSHPPWSHLAARPNFLLQLTWLIAVSMRQILISIILIYYFLSSGHLD